MSKSLSEPQSAIEATGLVKRFGRVTALDGLDLNVLQGEVHGFLGPNGAGKTTTIRSLLGQIRLDAGTARLFGLDAWRDAVTIHERLAYVPGDVTLWPNLTGGECIDLLGRLQGSQSVRTRTELVERFQLDPTRRTRTYSKGNRQKVALVAALSTDAELLLLDEPTSGLDPLMEAVFCDVVREAVTEGRTVLLSSHILAEVERLCDQVSIVRSGRVVSSGSLDELRQGTLTSVDAVIGHPIPRLAELPGVRDVQVAAEGDRVRIRFRVNPAALAEATRLVATADPTALVVAPPSLDELFLEHYAADEPAPETPAPRHAEVTDDAA